MVGDVDFGRFDLFLYNWEMCVSCRIYIGGLDNRFGSLDVLCFSFLVYILND